MIDALLRASLGGVIAVAVVWTIGRLAPRLSPAVRTTLWWLAAAKFLIGLVWVSPLEIPVLPASKLSVVQTTVATGAGVSQGTDTAAANRGSLNLEAIAVTLWMTGTAIAIVLGARQWRRASAIVRDSRPASDELTALASDLAGRLGIARVPAVLESELIETPLVTGLRRPAVVVPSSFHSLSPDQQRMALCHELAHVKRADLSLGAVPALAERIFFFHPLVHVASREYSIWREAACDRDVLDALDAAPDEYGRLLVDLGVSRPRAGLAAAGASWSFTSLKRRLSMLTESPNRSKYSRATAIAAIGVAALTLVPLTLSARPAQAPERMQAPERLQAQAEMKKQEPAMKIVLLGEKNRLRGERNDVITAMSYRTGDEKLVWFRMGDAEYVLRDAALFKRVDDEWEKANLADPPDFAFIEALMKRFADGGRATRVK